jgi:hypothetical protein
MCMEVEHWAIEELARGGRRAEDSVQVAEVEGTEHG